MQTLFMIFFNFKHFITFNFHMTLKAEKCIILFIKLWGIIYIVEYWAKYG